MQSEQQAQLGQIIANPRPEHRQTIARALQEGWAHPDVLLPAANVILRVAWPGNAATLVADDLLAQVLLAAPVRDPELERRLISVRRRLVEAGAPAPAEPLIARLAAQCATNEGAWWFDAQEAAAVAALGSPAMSACYLPTPDADDDVEAITGIRAGVSEQVRDQYEANPFPRWGRLTLAPQAPLEAILRATLPDATIDPLSSAPQVLVAGCGTGEHALQVSRYAGAQVLAIDLSRRSLAYAARKGREAGVQNVTFAQADLLELGDRSFDIIEAVGVLHHLADPFEGARALAGMLKPGGVMKLGLYSAKARAALAPAKALARGYEPTSDGIRALRKAILDTPDSAAGAALYFTDFYALSGCRDLLMHVQEHQLDVGDIRRMARENGLRFLGFAVRPGVRAAFAARFPQGDTDLDAWEAFEDADPTTFRGMYQFWLQKPAQ